ncbi:hypothetical protein [Carnimonas nigrificans]|uniref:hypothetical protein n=1 Tax=Carnimonas nigrificans TaxID=64323 RepID=UPI0012EBA474
MKRPEFWIIAGPNGAGKTTLSSRLTKRWGDIAIVNPDEIALEIDPATGMSAVCRVARAVLPSCSEKNISGNIGPSLLRQP